MTLSRSYIAALKLVAATAVEAETTSANSVTGTAVQQVGRLGAGTRMRGRSRAVLRACDGAHPACNGRVLAGSF